jgi:hypothetical protein
MLSNREWATAFWLGVLLAFVVWRADTRHSAFRIAVTLFHPVLLIPLLLFAAWMSAIVYGAWRLGVWQPAMLKDTLFWSATAFALFFRAPGAVREKGFLRGRLLDALGVGVFLGFYLGLATLDFIWEVLLQFVAFLAVGISAVAKGKAEYKQVKGVADATLGVLVLGLLVPPTVHVISDWSSIDKVDTLRGFLLPVWLTGFALPFIFALMVFSTYQMSLVRLGLGMPDGHVSWRAKLALALGFRLNIRDLDRFTGGWQQHLAEAHSLNEARRLVAVARAALRSEDAAKQREADDLARFAGVAGTDGEGRQLDRREFKETVAALDWLATLQTGQFHRSNRYRRDLLRVFGDFTSEGLPEDHGITMKVRRNGLSWFAWRRTPSGWCFAVGSAGPPPDQWFYDGPEPPKGYPAVDPAWVDRASEQSRNWLA